MAAVLGWGLWNQLLTEWFNPGGKRPYVKTREEAERMLRAAVRQYPMGKWELREFLAEEDSEDEQPSTGEAGGASARGVRGPGGATDRPDAVRPGTETLAAPRRGA